VVVHEARFCLQRFRFSYLCLQDKGRAFQTASPALIRAGLPHNPMKKFYPSDGNSSKTCAKTASTTRATTSGASFSELAAANTNGVGLPARVGL